MSQVELKSLLETLDPSTVKNDLIKLLMSREQQTVKEIQILVLEYINTRIVVDMYVSLSLEPCFNILCELYEPHDKHLFDHMCHHIKSSYRSNVLVLLIKLVLRQPSWLHKVVQHNIFQIILKSLKTDIDVPFLLGCLLFVSSIMPINPVAVSQKLDDINEIFIRLCSFQIHKPEGIPESYLLHLNAGTYHLFHRLYAMFPLSFLTHLRNEYTKSDRRVIDVCVKPMLDKVKMHCDIITSNKDLEALPDRWRSKELHDIMAQCSQHSLDVLEGSSEISICPIVAPAQLQKLVRFMESDCAPQDNPPSAAESAVKPSSVASEKSKHAMTPEATSIVAQNARSQKLATAPLCALVTPEPTRSSSTRSTSGRPTPLVTESPLSKDEATSRKVGSVTPGTREPRKRLSALSMTLLSTSLVPGDDQPPPMSPMKPLFTSEPPLNVQKMQAVRKITFPTQCTGDVVSQPCAIPTAATQADTQKHTPSMSELPDLIAKLETKEDDFDDEVSNLTITASKSAPTANNLFSVSMVTKDAPNVVDDDTDSEKGSPSKFPSESASSVREFMQQVERIRLNSFTVPSHSFASKDLRANAMGRSNSAPNFCQEEPRTPRLDRSMSQVGKQTRFNSESETFSSIHIASPPKGPLCESGASSPVDDEQRCSSALPSHAPEDLELLHKHFPYLHVFGARSGSLYHPSRTSSSNPSPLELLDRHITTASRLHGLQIKQAKEALLNTPAIETHIAWDQVRLLHTQLLFERHKREVHARRNRRLLGRVVQTAALREENQAMKESVRMMETEIKGINVSLKLQREVNNDLKEAKQLDELRRIEERKNFKTKVAELESKNKDLVSKSEKLSCENERLKKFLHSTKAHVFNLENELESANTKVAENELLRSQLVRANKELLLMRELQQHYQQRLVTLNESNQNRDQDKLVIESFKKENEVLQRALKEKSLHIESLKQKRPSPPVVVQKDDPKREIEKLELRYAEQLDALEEKFRSQIKVQQSLQSHILSLNAELHVLRGPHQSNNG